MNLSDKLRRFLPQQASLQEQERPTAVNLDPYLQGKEVETPYGTCYVIEKTFPLTSRHGSVLLRQMAEVSHRGLCHLEPGLKSDFQMEGALFIDTETTGLAGGTGTYAFLVGLGYFTCEEFVCRQLLMRDYNEEQALLWLLSKELQKIQALVTFNGKSFDVPLLQTRFTLARLPSPFSQPEHLDLLHMSRRLWRHKLESCSLNSLEANILGVNRRDDLPGYLIPQRYFDFLQTGNGELLQDIVRHNLTDILSMPALLWRLQAVGQTEPGECACPWEGEALAKLALANSEPSKALAYLQAAQGLCQEAEQHVRILKAQAGIYKRRRNYEQAGRLWLEVLNIFSGDLHCLEELAKYYEHQVGDSLTARGFANRGLTAALQTKSTEAPAWRHRLRRLQRKIQAGQQENNGGRGRILKKRVLKLGTEGK